MPQLSPSLTSSVTSMNSSSLHSPAESEAPVRLDRKFPPDDIDIPRTHMVLPDPYIRHNTPSGENSPPLLDMSYQQRSSPASASARNHVASPSQNNPRFHPYASPNKATPLELRLVSRSLGLSSPSARTLEDTQRAKAYFTGALKHIPRGVVQNAYMFKLADRECIAHRVALSMAELRSVEQRKNLLISIGEHRRRDLAVNEEELQILMTLLDRKRLTEPDVKGDEMLQRDTCKEELAELAVADQEVSHIQEAVRSQERRGWHVPFTFDSNHNDTDPIYSDDSSDDSGEHGEPARMELHGLPGHGVPLMECT
ncbi:hypothetical protein JVT61DRAFT_10471 [Boletus reticuloceps]|uniref:Uncharacterized protein n=1 Tax=Boletus reticuloceps TaxID=495285 RepID=A0A8I2YZA3_9AGAM|nr:hypothetical protein JVT61DRAFT_10471 [Boletus reticuloceps]